jgi:hypothetical protein
MVDKYIGSPKISVVVFIYIRAVFGFNKSEKFPRIFGVVFVELVDDMLADALYIVHKSFGIFKNKVVYFLKNVKDICVICAIGKLIGGVYQS